jgi:hypothetical protein
MTDSFKTRVYRISPENLRREKQRLAAGIITMFVAVPLSVALVAWFMRLDAGSLTTHDVGVLIVGLGLPSAALFLNTLTLPSLRVEIEDDRITKTQNRPIGGSLRISFNRQEIGHIREVGKHGLMIRGLGRRGRYIDVQIPRLLEDYDELKGRLAAWQPIHKSWI